MNTRQKKNKLLSMVVFIVFALPGLGLFLFSCLNLWAGSVDPQCNHLPLVISGPLAVFGMVIMLYGVGKWQYWRYYMIFLLIPVLFYGYISIDRHARGGKLELIAVVVLIGIFALYLARYCRCGGGR